MIMLKKFLYSLLLMMFSASAVHAEDANPKDESPFLAVPRLEAKPRIDGEMAEGEWANAAKLGGFMGATGEWGGRVTPMGSEIFLGHDGELFYMAARLQLPPGVTPSMNYRRRDEPVFMDSYQIELWLSPPIEDRLVSYQMIGNAYGAIFDNRQIKDLGVTDVNWDGNWTFKNSYEVGEVWTAELSIPFADLGVDKLDPQQLWRGLVGVAWPQRSWPYPYGFYANTGEHARLSMAETGSTVRIDDLSSLFENRLAPEMTLVNGANEAAEFHVTASVGDVTHEDRITVPALTSLPYRFEQELPDFPEGVKRQTMTLRVNGPDDQRLLAGDWHYQRVEQDELKPEPVEVKPWAMRTRVQFAPLSMGIKGWADLLGYPKRDQLDEVRFVVRSKSGDVAVIEKVVEDFSYDSAETYLWLPDNLEHGEYEVVTRFVDAEGEVLDEKADSFTHENLKERFVWLGTEVGEDIEVREPFEPVRVEGDGRELSVWGRTIGMEGALPSQITSKGAAMLARPIQLVAEVDGERVVAEMVEPIRVTETSDERAAFTGTYELAGLRLALEGVLEFDGMMLYELDAQPIKGESGEKIDRLFISMPVKAENAKYYFSTIGGWNPRYGATKAKDDSGLVWDSSDAADFVPYVFLSDDERALHWFADQDHAWVLGDDAPCARVVRDDEVVELQVNLVRKSGEVPAFAAQFGFIASPVRPILPHWRHTSLNGSPLADSKVNFFFGPGHGGTPIDLHDTETLVEVLEKALDIKFKEGDPNRVLAELPDEATDLRSIPPQKLRDAVPEKSRNNLGPLLGWLHHDDPNPHDLLLLLQREDVLRGQPFQGLSHLLPRRMAAEPAQRVVPPHAHRELPRLLGVPSRPVVQALDRAGAVLRRGLPRSGQEHFQRQRAVDGRRQHSAEFPAAQATGVPAADAAALLRQRPRAVHLDPHHRIHGPARNQRHGDRHVRREPNAHAQYRHHRYHPLDAVPHRRAIPEVRLRAGLDDDGRPWRFVLGARRAADLRLVLDARRRARVPHDHPRAAPRRPPRRVGDRCTRRLVHPLLGPRRHLPHRRRKLHRQRLDPPRRADAGAGHEPALRR